MIKKLVLATALSVAAFTAHANPVTFCMHVGDFNEIIMEKRIEGVSKDSLIYAWADDSTKVDAIEYVYSLPRATDPQEHGDMIRGGCLRAMREAGKMK